MDIPSTSKEQLTLTPPDVRQAAEIESLDLLPIKSKKLYLSAYETFCKWKVDKKVESTSESAILAYFPELNVKYQCSTLWQQYSMHKSTISLNENVNISKYAKLQAYLKRKSEGYVPKKANTFTPEDINKFLKSAPDAKYLPTNIALIMGIMGACRSIELYNMKNNEIQDLGTTLLVTVPNTKTKIIRKFTITGEFYKMCKEYIFKREVKSDIVFLQMRNAKLTKQRIGINSFIKMGRDIANFLKLANPENYSGHSFRRTSATNLVDAGGDITTLKRHGGWKSTTVAEGYINDSTQNKENTANKICNAITNISNSNVITEANIGGLQDIKLNEVPALNIKNCSKFTMNINVNK